MPARSKFAVQVQRCYYIQTTAEYDCMHAHEAAGDTARRLTWEEHARAMLSKQAEKWQRDLFELCGQEPKPSV